MGWSAARISSESQSRNPAQAAPLTGVYFGASGDELGMEATVEVTQPKQVEAADSRGGLEPSEAGKTVSTLSSRRALKPATEEFQ